MSGAIPFELFAGALLVILIVSNITDIRVDVHRLSGKLIFYIGFEDFKKDIELQIGAMLLL